MKKLLFLKDFLTLRTPESEKFKLSIMNGINFCLTI